VLKIVLVVHYVGDILFEIKTEADINDTTECPHDDMLSTGMFRLFVSVRIFCVSK